MKDKTHQEHSLYNIVYDDIICVTFCNEIHRHSDHAYVLLTFRNNEYTTVDNVRLYTNTSLRGETSACGSYLLKDGTIHIVKLTKKYFNRCIGYVEDFTQMPISEYTCGNLNYMEV